MSWVAQVVSRGLTAVALATLIAVPNLAAAEDDDVGLPGWYAGPLVGYMQPDSARDADRGINLHGVLGVTLADSVALELNGFGTRVKRTSGGYDAINGAGLDLTLGTPAAGNPFFLLGGGAVQQQLAGLKKSNTFAELGLGVYLPFSFFGELWRVEARYGVIFNDHPTLIAENLLEDGRINFGFLIPFGRQPVEHVPDDSDGDGVPDNLDKCPATPAGTPVDANGCPVASAPNLTDSDGDGIPDANDKCPDTAKGTLVGPDGCSVEPDADEDGVPDSKDQCPNTPKWARVDAKGCIPDSDGDGVDDARDDCPDTAPGVTVDRHGCVPLPAPVMIGDEDHDGVPDNVDACPHTAPRTDIDAKGCLIPMDVTAKDVHFELNSPRLTGDGYILLRQVAAAMKAQPELKIEVVGYADNTGTKKFNLALSKERAEVVRDFLTYAGVPESQLTISWHGFDNPTATNNHPEGRAYNRRVEFHKINP